MNERKILDNLTNEIRDGLYLPHSSKEFIRRRIQRAFAAGYNKRASFSGRRKPVVQLTKEGTFIEEWPSCRAAERGLDLNHSDISRVCRKVKHSKTVGGFKFMFSEEYYSNKKADQEMETRHL